MHFFLLPAPFSSNERDRESKKIIVELVEAQQPATKPPMPFLLSSTPSSESLVAGMRRASFSYKKKKSCAVSVESKVFRVKTLDLVLHAARTPTIWLAAATTTIRLLSMLRNFSAASRSVKFFSGAAYKKQWIWSEYNQFLPSYSIELLQPFFSPFVKWISCSLAWRLFAR